MPFVAVLSRSKVDGAQCLARVSCVLCRFCEATTGPQSALSACPEPKRYLLLIPALAFNAVVKLSGQEMLLDMT